MKILYVNGKFLSQPVTGVQRYAHDVVSAWDDALGEGRIDSSRFAIRVVPPRGILKCPPYRHISIVRSAVSGKLWEQCELPLRTLGALMFSPYAAAPLAKRRHIVTIHDAGVLATPQQYSFVFRAYYAAAYKWMSRNSLKILTVSQFSKEEIKRYCAIPSEKIVVVHPGCDHLLKVPANDEVLKRFGLESGRFVLGVSSRSPIKNFEGLAQAWRLLGRRELKLAIAGRTNGRVFRNSDQNSDSAINWLGYVSDGELRALYEAAAVFVYPSFYEGFGYPPLEAMSCGCPVLVSKCSALPESSGDAAVYCDPSSPEDIADKIASIVGDSSYSRMLREKGKQHAAQFTIRATASRLWDEIESLL